MLYVSLILTAFLVLAAHWSAKPYPRQNRLEIYVIAAIAVLFAMMGSFFISLTVAAVGIGLFLGLLFWHSRHQRMRRFWPISLIVVILAYSFGFSIAIEKSLRKKNLQKQFPLESLAERLPIPPPQLHHVFTPYSAKQMDQIDDKISISLYSHRRQALYSVHKNVVYEFVNSPGFGVTRMDYLTISSFMKPMDISPVEQSLAGFSPEPPPKGEMPFVGALDDFRSMHLAATVDFVNPDGFGYIKDREHVAGFQSHAFRKKPEMKDFEVQSVELLSLLLHPESAVYVANQLPAMEQLKSVPTRSLDKFEANGLEAIRKGEDLHVAHYGDRLRMVGAIRNSTKCIKCHGGQRGDLLGAFVYSLQEGKKKLKKD
jgi:hypothetical protein